MKRGTRFKMQMKSLGEYRAKHPKEKEIDVNVEIDKLKKQLYNYSDEYFKKIILTNLHRTVFRPTILFIGVQQNDLLKTYIEQSEIKEYNIWTIYFDNLFLNDVEKLKHFHNWLCDVIKILSPSLIVCLGDNVFNCINKNLENYKLTKVLDFLNLSDTEINKFVQQLNALKKLAC